MKKFNRLEESLSIKKIFIVFTFAFSALVSANEVEYVINTAKAAQKEAADLGFEWRDTGKIIKQAEAAANEGKNKKAIILANTIIEQISAVRRQAALAKTAGPRF